jgi:hypothetical protein
MQRALAPREGGHPMDSKQASFKTPEQPDYFHYYVYGTEKETASAKFQQKNDNTNLRKPPKDKSAARVPQVN